ncbi:MAG: YafY family transcriptional regulator [Treponema sp.]|nr:YafY family transcriptional regulator [Treponema sp.]
MQIDQLFEFVYVLIDKKRATAKEMAARFGVSVRTIYRWVDALCVSGIPIYSLKGRGGGIAISEKFAMDNTLLSEEDRLAIVSSVKALNALGANVKTEQKLSHLVASEADWLEVDFAPWSPEGSEVRTLFATLRDSILKKRQVVFDYFSGDGKAQKKTVHPWKLLFKGQAWYLDGWSDSNKEERFFKLSRMRNVIQTGRAATVSQNSFYAQKLDGDKKSARDLYPAQEKPKMIAIKAKVAAQKISYLMDAFVCQEVKVGKDKSAAVTFLAPDTPWICEYLLSFGPDLKIVSPARVKEQVVQLAQKISLQYQP